MSCTPDCRAQKLITDYYYDNPKQIDLENLLFSEKLSLKTGRLNNCDGRIVFNENRGIITISDRITNQNQKRFLIAHEMGHFFNERESKRSSNIIREDEHLFRKSDYHTLYSDLLIEKEANQFASELLMYEPWFNDFCSNRWVSKELFKDISEEFNVSLTAAALRYKDKGEIPIAVILSKDRVIKWAELNPEFPYRVLQESGYIAESSSTAGVYERFEYYKYPKYRYNVYGSRNTVAGNISERTSKCGFASEWFMDVDFSRGFAPLNILNFPMQEYNSILTLLWESRY